MEIQTHEWPDSDGLLAAYCHAAHVFCTDKTKWQKLLNMTPPTARKYLHLSGRPWTDPLPGMKAVLPAPVWLRWALHKMHHVTRLTLLDPVTPAELEMLRTGQLLPGWDTPLHLFRKG